MLSDRTGQRKRFPRLEIVLVTCSLGVALAFGVARSTRVNAQSAAVELQRVGDAVVSKDPQEQTWTIGNTQLQVRFRVTSSRDFVLDQIRNPTTGHVFPSTPDIDSTVDVNGRSVAPGSAAWSLNDATASEFGTGVRIDFTFRSPSQPLVAVRSYACYPGSAIIETWTRFQIAGTTPVTLANENVWHLTVPAVALNYVQGLRPAADLDSAFARRTIPIRAGAAITLTEPNRSTETYLPMITADVGADELLGGLLWSGSWQIDVQGVAGQPRISAGLPRLSTTVDASHPHETPHGFFGFIQGDQNDASDAVRQFVLYGIRSGRPFEPLVTYNTWFAYGTEIDEPTMQDEMVAAAKLGVELFVVDAGWYVGARGPVDFSSGLGTWTVDPARFPNGLGALSAYAHSLGLRFGLWVEPERVDAATIGRPGLVRESWLAKNNGNYIAPATPQVCLASQEARQWVFDELTRLLDDVQPDYLKWDNNLWVNCNRSGHGHGANDGNYAHVAGLYDLLGALRARYPNLLIENCSQGGNRLDFGLLRFTDTAWMDDRTIPASHVRHNLEGVSAFFPPAHLLSFAASGTEEVLGTGSDLPLSMRSRMPGVLGLTYRAVDLTEDDRIGIAKEIALYKRMRDTVRDASARLLTDQAGEQSPPWDALQEIARPSGNAIIFAFQNDGGARRVRLQPAGLEPAATYLVTREDGTLIGSAGGADLMADGVEIDGSPESAAHVLVFQKEGEVSSPAIVRKVSPGR